MTRTLRFPALILLKIALIALLTGCSASDVINRLTPSDYVRTADIAYDSKSSNARMRLDVYQPVDKPAHAPVVVFFYGGSWRGGSKDDYVFIGEALAARGIVAVIADYRVYPEVRYPDFLKDCAAALAWTFREIGSYGGDAQRIFVSGHSAGAYNAAMLAYDARLLAPYGLKPGQLRGFVGIAGPYNFLPIDTENIKPVFFYPDTPLDSQPINHVGKTSSQHGPKTLLIAAEQDKVVSTVRNTEAFAAKLRENGIDVAVKVYPHVSHVTLIGAMAGPLHALAPVREDFVNFVLNN